MPGRRNRAQQYIMSNRVSLYVHDVDVLRIGGQQGAVCPRASGTAEMFGLAKANVTARKRNILPKDTRIDLIERQLLVDLIIQAHTQRLIVAMVGSVLYSEGMSK